MCAFVENKNVGHKAPFFIIVHGIFPLASYQTLSLAAMLSSALHTVDKQRSAFIGKTAGGNQYKKVI